MRNFIFLIIIFLLTSCGKRLKSRIYIADEHKYELRKDKFYGDFEMKEVNYNNGQLMDRGNYAYDKEGNLSNLKTGDWTSYYENGQLKSKGKYNIGSFIQCCFSGACKQFYNYKVGSWEYFYSNGQLKAAGEYETKQLHVNTSCEGGDNMSFGITTSQWKYFNEKGETIEPNAEFIIEFEKVKSGGNTMASYLFPDSKKENIEMEFDK